MTALTQDRNTQRKYVERMLADDALLAANTTIFNGSLVSVNAAGALIPASDTAATTVVGVAQRKMVNTTGVAAKIARGAAVAAGVFKFATSGGNALTAADIGKNVFVLDAQTVVKTAGTVNTIVAGTLEAIESDGVWIAVGI